MIKNKKVDTLLICFSIMVTVNCLGRFMLATAKTLEMAIWATKFLYVGGCFTPMLTVFLLARLCQHKIHKGIKIFLISFSSIVMCFVMTIGKYDIYYKDFSLAQEDGYSYLIKEYGPAHTLYPVMMMMYAVIMIAYICYSIKNRKSLSIRTVVTLSVSCFTVIFLYIFERIIGTNVSLLSAGYLVGIALIINYFDRLNIYDMSANVITAIEKMDEYGYIVFDDRYRYINSNGIMKEVFPEINYLTVECEVPHSDSFFCNEIIEFLYSWDEKESSKKTITVNDRYFDMEIRVLSYGRKEKVGYIIEFIDRTIEKRYMNAIENYNVSLEKEVEQKTANIIHIKDMMVLGMADMVESRDNNTGGHIKRTSAVVKIFSEKLYNYCDKFGFDERFLTYVTKAAPMHDLGKIAIDDVILRKPGRYTEEEFNKMKKHSEEGARIVSNILNGVEDEDFVRIAENVAHYHHEKWNGQGYPMGIAGEQIPIEARIMALADVFDALVSKRCYKEAFTYEEAFKIIEESLGSHFDPELGRIFLECREDLEKIYNQYC